MYTHSIDAPAGADAWAVFQTYQDLRDAIAALDTAMTALASLAVDTEWCSKGVRTLHGMLVDLRIRSYAESADTRHRLHEVAGVTEHDRPGY